MHSKCGLRISRVLFIFFIIISSLLYVLHFSFKDLVSKDFHRVGEYKPLYIMLLLLQSIGFSKISKYIKISKNL